MATAGLLQAKFNMDPQQWIRNNKEYARIISKAQTLAIRDVGKIAQASGREMISAAGFGPRWVKSLIVRYKPQKGYSFSPEANVRSTIGYSNVFETGKVILGKQFLWIPSPQVPRGRGRPHMTPEQYSALVGPLFMIHHPGQLPILAAHVKTSSIAGRKLSRATLKRGKQTSRGTVQTVFLFIGVPVVTIKKRWSIHQACVEAARKLPERYNANLETYK